MLRLGPLVLLAALTPAAQAAGTCKKPAAFNAKFIGEGAKPGDPCPVQGDTGDYREEISRQAGGAKGDRPVDADHDAVAQPPPLPPGQPVFPTPRQPAPADSAVPAQLPPSAVPAAPAPAPAPASGPRWSWPGPESPEARRRRLAAEPPAKEKAGDEDEDLRDAPAAVAPERYSLWAGLSKPLLLSARMAGSAAPAEAKALGEADYASHILSQAAVDLPAAGNLGAPSAPAAPSERKAVRVELDVKDTPGAWQAGAAALAEAAGFEPDPKEPARFLGAARARVVLAGTVLPERMGELLGVARVLRVESPPPSGAAAPPSGQTRVLVGLRLPTEGTPAEAVAKASARLDAAAGFKFEKALAIQQIPGSDQKVLVIAGALPVRAMAALLSDPQVVKVAPSPADDAARPLAVPGLPAWKKVLAGAAGERRLVFLAAVLSCLALWGPFLQGRKRTRRA